jgi:signal transduction histidine kinase/ActR/RegA family two-component response regulator
MTSKRDLFLAVDYVVVVVVIAFAAVNVYLGDWLLFATNIVIISVCIAALRIAKLRSEDQAAVLTLLYLGPFICAVLLVAVHLYPVPFPIEGFVLPFLMLLLTLGAVFLPRRAHVVILSAVVFATAITHLILTGIDGPIEVIRAVTALTFASVVSVAAFVFQATRAELVRTSAEATALAEARRTFLANMSHEIRTPLGAISGLIDLMAQDEGSRAEYFESLRSSVRDLRGIVDDILDFERNSSVGIVAVPAPFSATTLISDLVKIHGAGSQGVIVRADLSQAPDQAVVADSARIRQILRNLLNNAMKFTTEGEVVLSCRRVIREGSAESLAFLVSDTGPGIEPDRLEGMFEPFVQRDNSYTRRHRGTGLGLAISRQIAHGLGGTLTAVSEPGRGSTFTLTVPVHPYGSPHPAPMGLEPAAPEPPPRASADRPLAILLAEDDEINALVTKRFCEKLGHRVERVGNGAAAIVQFESGHFDIVLMDLQMPDVDGLTATRRIRESEARAGGDKRVPVFCLTAFVSDHERTELIEAGATDVLHKPTSQEALAQAFASLLPPV